MVARADSDLPLDASIYSLFDSVVYISASGGSGSGAHLKGTNYILTAAHVAENMGATEFVVFSRYGPDYNQSGLEDIEFRNVVSRHIHPLYKADGSTPEFDLALIEIGGAAPFWSQGYELYTSPQIYQREVWFAGYGLQGLGGAAPAEGNEFRKSWGANTTDTIQASMGNVTPSGWDEKYLEANYSLDYFLTKSSSVSVMDFDSGLETHNAFKFEDEDDWQWHGELGVSAEGIPQPGDSGAPILDKANNSIIGVVSQIYTSNSDPDWSRFGNFGEISVNASPAHASGWIESISKERPRIIRRSNERVIEHDEVSNYIVGTSDGTQRFHVNLGDDWYTSHIYQKDGLVFIDGEGQYITLEGISNIRVKAGTFGFGTDITIKNGSITSAAAPKTPIPDSFDFVGTGTYLSDRFIDQAEKSEKLYGSAGTDTFVIPQNWFSFHDVEVSSSGVVVRAYETETVDVLIDFERILFSNKAIAYDTDGVAGQAYRIYKAAFDRAPDESGLGFWINSMDKGVSLNDVANGFVNSNEFVSKYGVNASDEDFIRLLYENVLDRQPDSSGYTYWLTAMSNGQSRAQILAEFSESVENIANTDPWITNGISYQPFG